MKVLHVISGGETGGSRKHLLQLFSNAPYEADLLLLTEGEFAEMARKEGIRVTVIPQASRLDRSTPQKILTAIKENNYSIVHSHGARANFLINGIRKKLGIPWVVTVHSDPSLDFLHQPKLLNKGFTFLNVRALRNADHLFAVSDEFKRMLIKLGIDSNKITPVFNGIEFHDTVPNYDRNAIRKAQGAAADDFIFAIVARLHPVKGHRELLEAFSRMQIPNRKLWIIGDGALRETLEKQAAELRLGDRVRFLGTRSDVDSLLFAADVSLLTSYSESFPLVLLESADMETPVIATNVGGVRDLVEPGRTGWVIPPKDVDALVQAAEEAAAADTAEMGRSLRTFAQKQFSNANLQKKLLNSYQKIIGIK